MNEPVRLGEQAEAPLLISVDRPRPDVVVVRLRGDLDLLTAPLLREALRPLIHEPGTVLVNLTGVGFLGSAGLAELAGAQDGATGNGARLALVASGRAVVRPLEVTGLAELFQIFDSEDAALAAL
jgi:anti-sigma B factor antagonist